MSEPDSVSRKSVEARLPKTNRLKIAVVLIVAEWLLVLVVKLAELEF